MWEHFRFTGDRDFLSRTGYPAIRGAAQFCSDWLVDDGKGHLVTPAGNSPEISFRYTDGNGKNQMAGISMGPTMDMGTLPQVRGFPLKRRGSADL
jgi:alpha-L-fucosidase 2